MLRFILRTKNPARMPFVYRQPEELSFRHHLPGMIFFFVITFGTLRLAHRLTEPIQTKLGLVGAQIGKNPPWYFIHRDFAEGVSSGIVLLIAWTLAVIFWRRFRPYSSMCIWMPWIWLGGKIANAIIIHRECPGLLDGGPATTSWQTFDSYLEDPEVAFFRTAVLWSGVAMSLVLSWAEHRRRQKQVAMR